MKWNHSRHKIIAITHAMSVIEEEAYGACKANKERGGSLVGIQTAAESIILYAITTGPNADTSCVHIKTDADFQNQRLAAIWDRYKHSSVSPVYLADFHVHQMGYDKLSFGDCSTLLDILRDPDHSYLLGLPVILVSCHGSKFEYLPFWITRAGCEVRTEKAELEIVKPDDSRIKALLQGKSYVPLKDIMSQQKIATTPKTSEGLILQRTGDILMTRLQLEMEHIKATFSIQSQLRRTRSGYPCLVAQIGEYRFFAVIPSEFPLNPATILFRKPNAPNIEEYSPRRSWNSIARIADVFEEMLETNINTKAVNIQA